MLGFKNVKAYIEGKGVITTDIAVENGLISRTKKSKITETFPYAEGQIVVPGFIDKHIHGANGADTMDAKIENLSVTANAITKEGTTAFLATTMTQDKSLIISSLSALKEYIEKESTGATLLGAHLEGPFISKKHIGAQPEEYISVPSVELFDEFLSASGNNIKTVTLSPETDGATELIKYLKEKGIVISAGHTDASYDEIEKATKDGLTSITHTFNAQKGIHHRDIGTAGAGLLLDELYTEIICDLIHLSAPAIKLVLKCKPKDKIILITDSMRAKYLPEGESELGGQKVIVSGNSARLKNGALAGSILKMNDAIRNLVCLFSVPLTTAIDFATINPAKNLGIDKIMGSIAVGKRANFTVLDKDFNVCTVIVDGKVVYKA